ncbi:hypothetical protein ABW21_db0202873 [Orbilia brochopaga]|nr:hypothetical protein ABW21_db0202873 [Drechslerella brochopaga]
MDAPTQGGRSASSIEDDPANYPLTGAGIESSLKKVFTPHDFGPRPPNAHYLWPIRPGAGYFVDPSQPDGTPASSGPAQAVHTPSAPKPLPARGVFSESHATQTTEQLVDLAVANGPSIDQGPPLTRSEVRAALTAPEAPSNIDADDVIGAALLMKINRSGEPWTEEPPAPSNSDFSQYQNTQAIPPSGPMQHEAPEIQYVPQDQQQTTSSIPPAAPDQPGEQAQPATTEERLGVYLQHQGDLPRPTEE